jgi:branched-chain amino acid transport system permease protein
MRLPFRNEIAVLVGALLLVPLLPKLGGSAKSVPLGVIAFGLVSGASVAMQAIGVVLAYRSHRFINFGQVYIGGLAATMFTLSVQYQPLFRWLRSVCPVCAENPGRGLDLFNYWLSLVVSLGFCVLIAWLVFVLIVKRFEGAPRLVLTVASIFLGPAAGSLGSFLTNTLTTVDQRRNGLSAIGKAPLPFNFTLSISPAKFHAADVLTVVFGIGAAVGLFLYFRWSPTGNAIRAASDNPVRAQTLGVNVNAINTRVWLIIGLLSGIPAILATMNAGGGSIGGLSVGTAVRVLLVAVIARFVSLPMAAAGAVVLGIFQQATLWVFNGSTVPLDGALVLVVAGLLLLQAGQQRSRADAEDATGWKATREVRPIPRELRDLPVVRKWLRIGGAVLAVIVLGFPWAMSPSQTNLGAVVVINAIVALSLLVLTGWAGQVSLGQFAFAAIGAWVGASLHAPFIVCLVAGTVAGGVVATVIGIPALRLRGMYLAISTLAFAVSVTAVLINPRYLGKGLPDSLKRPVLFGMNFDDPRVYYYFTLLMLAGVVVVLQGLRRSRTGRALIATRENENAAQSYGISLIRIRLQAFAISGAIAAFAGVLLAFHQREVSVNTFSEAQSFGIFTMAVIGGLGSVAGPILGAVYNGLFLIFGGSAVLQLFLLGFGGLGLLLVMPGGLSQIIISLRDSLLRRIGKRNRILVPSLMADSAVDRDDGRAALAPKLGGGGAAAFVPERYGLEGQWALHVATDDGAGPADEFTGMRVDDLAPEEETVGG